MAQGVISTAILIIAAIVATVALVNAVYPSLFATTDSVGSVAGTASDRMKTDVQITMPHLQNASALSLWVKNVGSTKIAASRLAYTDLYFGAPGNMSLVTAGGDGPFHWGYLLDDVDGDGSWGPGETLQILITDAGGLNLAPGPHEVKLVLYNSATVEDTITI